VTWVSEQFDRAIAAYAGDPKLIHEQANHEDTFRTGGYANRQISELVQNAADAITNASSRGRIEVWLTADALYCANEGSPWRKEGLDAVTHAYMSAQTGAQIGRFGLGFKSTLSVSDHVQVFSETISFEFNSPAAREAIDHAIEDGNIQDSVLGGRRPILRTPTLVDVQGALDNDPILLEMSSWATSVVKLPRLSNSMSLSDQVRNFRTEFLLFANSISSLTIKIQDDENPLEQEHVCLSEGDDVFVITTPEGKKSRWLVNSLMHRPSDAARKDVGDAISRDEVKISFAAPLDGPTKAGEFWAYYPLKDITTASGIFNAPWSVNDDRTNLLEKTFNDEILDAFSDLFVATLPRLRAPHDPSRHFDYMPSRINENEGYADRYLTTWIPRKASILPMIPDPAGTLRLGSELSPLDLALEVPVEWMKLWTSVSHTSKNVPHYTVYTSGTRRTRLRDLFAGELIHNGIEPRAALEQVPAASIGMWLTELASSPELSHAADAIKMAAALNKKEKVPEGLETARIIPAVGGERARPSDRGVLFLSGESTVVDLGFRFVDPGVLQFDGVTMALKLLGFSPLDPSNELKAILRQAKADSPDEFWASVSNAIDGILPSDAAAIVRGHVSKLGVFKVLTRSGAWRDAHAVLNLEKLGVQIGDSWALSLQDTNAQVAKAGGVIEGVDAQYEITEDPLFGVYQDWARQDFERRSSVGPSARIQQGSFIEEYSPGPINLLRILSENEDSEAQIIWSRELLVPDSPREWIMQSDQRGGMEESYVAPHIWAVQEFGLIRTSWGARPPIGSLHQSLIEYADLLPIAENYAARRLPLVDELAHVPLIIWREFLSRDWSSVGVPRRKVTLSTLILKALDSIPRDELVERIPAIVGSEIRSIAVSEVRIGQTSEEEAYLTLQGIPHVMVDSDVAAGFIEGRLGCVLASKDVSFTVEIEGAGEPEFVTDRYPVLRDVSDPRLRGLQIVRCKSLAKRITSSSGAVDKFVKWLVNEDGIMVDEMASDAEIFHIINVHLELGLSASDIENFKNRALSDDLVRRQQSCVSASSDAERLGLLVGADRLAQHLPQGLIGSLHSFNRTNLETDIPALFLDVYGFGALVQLKEILLDVDPDTPRAWAGSAAASSFVRKYGFSSTFAGEQTQSLDRQFTIQGKPGLKELHPYQATILESVQEVLLSPLGNANKAMVELPTGSGKTRVAVESVVRLFLEGRLRGPVLWIAQSEELCEQAVNAWSEVWREFADTRALTIGRLWSGRVVNEPTEELSVVVATDAMLDTPGVIGSSDYGWLAEASAVIADEAHTAGDSPRYTRILRWLGVDGRSSARPLLGLSATPFKGTSEERTRRLAARFGTKLIQLPESDPFLFLQKIGVLSRVKHELLKGARIQLNQKEQEQLTQFSTLAKTALKRVDEDEERTKRLVEHIAGLNPEWPVLVFTASVLSAQVLAALLKTQGIPAASVSGETPKNQRRRVIEQFRKGEIRVLTNCEVLTEGFDAPHVRALYIARPTLSPNAYIQMAGRGLRGPLNGGSSECLIVDLEDSISNMGRDLAYREFVDLWQGA
jgi:superfamily II DNA or RNA helicase